ncbi:hypothetical protein Acr_00g0087970 [Actinidia rufa]|uniref:AP180 N-terminal homology (ANTH) domain-containing protein n=1 Tax=Actinidia rufa TaxID=165716 RepID=A0A7J0DWX1_9ERIC|nr:hypothetical protein Acr_00g0087970 [Actinidia rufa]
MGRQKKLMRNFIGIIKDRASLIKAALSIKRATATVRAAVLRATTHSPSSPPKDHHVAAVLALGRGSRPIARACIAAIMDRLHGTSDARVALKCLITLRHVVARGTFILRDQLSFFPAGGGRNLLQRLGVPRRPRPGEDYRSTQSQIGARLSECVDRIDESSFGESAELTRCLVRLQECRERLVALFVNRQRNDAFWDLVRETKVKAEEERDRGRWTVTVSESTWFEERVKGPSQRLMLAYGGVWDRVPLTVMPAMA